MNDKNIQYISDSYLCSNCGACATICKKDAISFKWTSMGRMFASIDNDRCVNCGKCSQVCPSIVEPTIDNAQDKFIGNILDLYVGRATDNNIFKNAQSGGLCTALLSYLFDSNRIDCAVVCHMEAGMPIPVVKASIVTNKNDLLKSQKSCYTPVELLTTLNHTSDYKSVAFVGLPCHIEGLTNLQRVSKQYNNITYKIGLICDRTMCRTVMDVFSTFIKSSNNIKIDWRRKYDEDKDYHYEKAPVVVYSDSETVQIPNSIRFIMKEYFTAPRCRVCFDKINTQSDITLGDPWRMPNVNLVEGASVVICRTEIGQTLLHDAMRECIVSIASRPHEEVVIGQLIDDRRKDVVKYANTLKSIYPMVDSFLIRNADVHSPLASQITDFIQRERMKRERVVEDALQLIKKKTAKPSLLFRVKVKIVNILRSYGK